jgi:hypothetical protein
MMRLILIAHSSPAHPDATGRDPYSYNIYTLGSNPTGRQHLHLKCYTSADHT